MKEKLELPAEMKKELEKALEDLKKGYSVRPPWLWFFSTKEMMKEMYPDRSDADLNTIVAGIWHKMSQETQMGIVERMLKGEDGLMATPLPLGKEDIEKLIKKWEEKRR